MDFSFLHIRYLIGYVYHICLQDTIQSPLSLCLLCQAMLLPMPLQPLLLTTRSCFQGEPWGASPRPSAPTYLPTSIYLYNAVRPKERVLQTVLGPREQLRVV